MKRTATPLGWDASLSQVTPQHSVRLPQQFAGTQLCSKVKRGTVKEKFLAKEHNRVTPARARTRTTRSGVQRPNHSATVPPLLYLVATKNLPFNEFKVQLVLLHISLRLLLPNAIDSDSGASNFNLLQERKKETSLSDTFLFKNHLKSSLLSTLLCCVMRVKKEL